MTCEGEPELWRLIEDDAPRTKTFAMDVPTGIVLRVLCLGSNSQNATDLMGLVFVPGVHIESSLDGRRSWIAKGERS